MFHKAMSETKKELDRYFNQKVKEFEEKTAPKTRQPYVDPYPEEAYRGVSRPMSRLIFSTTDATHIVFNRKLVEYRAAWKLKDRLFMDSKHTLPVSEGWAIECSRGDGYPDLSETHSDKAKEAKLSHKEYHTLFIEKYDVSFEPVNICKGCGK